MKEETEDVIVAGESPPLKNEASSGPLRSRAQHSRPLKSREVRSRSALESAKLDTDQEDLPLEEVNGIFLISESENFIQQIKNLFFKKLIISLKLVQLLGFF
jgi:hypothetical protein